METLSNLNKASKVNSSEANFSGLYWEAKEGRNAIYNSFIYMAVTRPNSFGILQVNKFHFNVLSNKNTSAILKLSGGLSLHELQE